MKPINLCSNRCCPTIERDGKGFWIITDDYGGKVHLSEEELENLIRIKEEIKPKS